MDFIILNKTGLYCKAGDFYLDPKKPVKNAVISHAHADHAVKGNLNVFCTPPTEAIMEKRYGTDAASSFSTFSFSESFQLNGVTIVFYPAGHILGSAQVLMQFEGITYLYTGDYKTSEDISCEGFQLVKADVLITESTFADPDFSHPDSALEIAKLNTVQNNIILGAYPVGKAQRVTALISKHCPDKEIYIHPRITAFHHISKSFGMELGKWNTYPVSKIESTKAICIVPPDVYRRYNGNKSYTRVFATGWGRRFYGGDFSLVISDHADWSQLLETIEKTEARRVFTVHGNGTKLVSHFAEKGIEVQQLKVSK